MRTLLMIMIGIALAVAFDAVPAILKQRGSARAFDGARTFVLIWLGIVVVDFGFGVAAGYSAWLELAVHALIFTVPAVTAWYLWRRRASAAPH
jgi:uncharacterized protein (DUF983 family)